MDAIEKYGREKITDTEYLLGDGQTTSSTVTVIHDVFILIMGEAMMQYYVYTAMVQDIINKDISSTLVLDAMVIFVA